MIQSPVYPEKLNVDDDNAIPVVESYPGAVHSILEVMRLSKIGYVIGVRPAVDLLQVASLVSAVLGYFVIHDVAPVPNAKVPAEQELHIVAPVVAKAVPTGQSVQMDKPVEFPYFPEGQDVQVVDAVEPLYVPIGHDVHGNPEE